MQKYNAVHIRQSPNLRQAVRDAMKDNTALFGSFVGLPSPDVARVMAATNTDWLCLDAEHTPFSPTLLSEMVSNIRYQSQGRVIPIVRVPTHTHEWIAWAIDAGAGGVIIPHTETGEQVQESINAARFPPHGKRSFPPFALLPIDGQTDAPEGKTWFQVANEHVAVIPQIESLKGVENAEDIIKHEGVDAVMVGRMDLTLDMGMDEAAVDAAVKRVEALAKKYNKPLLSFIMSPDEIPSRIDNGYHILLTAIDVYLLTAGTNELMAKAKEAAKVYNEKRLLNGNGNGKADATQ